MHNISFFTSIAALFVKKKQEITSIISRVLSLGLQFVVINQITQLAGVEGYGSYIFIFTVIGQLIHIDLGQSLYHQTRLSKGYDLNIAIKNGELDGIISTTLAPILVIVIFIMAICTAYNHELNKIINLGVLETNVVLITTFMFCASSLFSRFLISFGKGNIFYYSQAIFLVVFSLFLYINKKFFHLNADLNIPLYLATSYYFLLSFINISIVYVLILKKVGLKAWYYCNGKMFQWLKSSRGFWLYGIIGIAITQLDIFILGGLGSKEDLAYYSLINKIFFGGIYTILFVYVSLMQPKLTYYFEKKNIEKINNEILTAIALSSMILILACSIFFIFMEDIFRIMFPTYKTIETIKEWIFSFYIFYSFRVFSDILLTFYIAILKSKMINIITICQSIISLITQYHLFKLFGINGLLYGLIITYSFSLIIYSYYYIRIMNNVGKKVINNCDSNLSA